MMKILYVEDNPSDADLTRQWLSLHAPHMILETVETQSDAIARITKQGSPRYDLILTDLRLPDGDGLSLLTYIRERGLPFAVVVITGTGDEGTAVTALKAGADDYVSKRGEYLERLPLTLENALRHHRSQAARQARPLKALYAERHDTDIDLTLRHLQRHAPHIQLDVARTGDEALLRLPQSGEAGRYDVILLDYRLPGLNALEVLKEPRPDRDMDIPVVLCTGQGDEEVALQALKLGAASYLVKNPGYLHQLPGELENAFYRSEIVREQEALKRSEERLRLAQRAARIGAWDWNLVTGESNWSEGIYELLGLPQGDGRASVEDFVGSIHPEDREPAMDRAQSVIRHGEEYYDEFRITRPDGSIAWLASKGRVIRGISGNAERMIGVNIDITERRQVEESLRESEARFRTMADNAPVMVWVTEADGACSYVSQSWYEFTGQSQDAGLGFGWVDALHPDDREFPEKTFLAANEKREAFRLEYRLRRKDGVYRWAIDSARPRFGSQGEFLGYIGSVVDITETKRAELNTQFINQLDFELSQIADADEIIRLATSRLGEYLGVTSCYVIEVNPAAGLAFVRESWAGWRNAGPGIVGEYRISDFVTPECLDEFNAGRATVVKDVMNDPRIRDFASKYRSLGIGAFISIPALNEKQWEANLTVDHPRARDWRPDETQLMRDITARLWPAFKRARAVEALREVEESLRLALEAGRMGVWEWDTRTNAVKWSKEHYTVMGLIPFSVEPGYHTWADRVYPDDLPATAEAMSSAIEKKREYRCEYRIVWAYGSVRWVEGRGKPIYDEDGKCLKVRGLIVDITESKRAELNTQFINQLDLELSQIADADEIIRLATSRLGEYLGAASCFVIEVNPAADLAFVRESWNGWRLDGKSIVGEYRISDFTTPEFREALEAGHAAVVNDVRIDPRTRDFASKYESFGVGAFVTIPALNEKHWEASLNINHPHARDWRPDETQLMRDITARLWPAFKRARAVEALRESEERFRQLAENIGAAFFITEGFSQTPPGQLRYVSPAYEKIWGRSRESLYQDARSWLEAVHPDDIERVLDALRSAGRAQFDEEFRITRPDGEIRWVHDRVFPIRDEDGEIYRLAGIVEDITGRKMIEEALRESEERYRSVVESQTELICRYLPDTTLTFVNDSYCHYFDKTQEELIGTKFLDLIPEPAREAARKHIESLVENPRIEIDEHEVLLPDGGIGWQQWVDHAILDSNGIVVEFQAVGRDITERKRAEEERREGEERLRLALEAGRMGVWEWDTRTNAVEWSKENFTILGLEPFSVEPDYHTWTDLVHPDDLPLAVGELNRAIAERGEFRYEYRVIRPDGIVRWVEA